MCSYFVHQSFCSHELGPHKIIPRAENGPQTALWTPWYKSFTGMKKVKPFFLSSVKFEMSWQKILVINAPQKSFVAA